MSTEYSTLLATISVASTPIGSLRNVRWGFNVSTIVDHDIGGGDPTVHEPFETTYTITASWGWVADALRAAIKGTKVEVIIYPRGNTAGMPRHTLTDCLLNFEEGLEKGNVIMVNVSGSYRTETIDTVPD